MRLFAGLDLPKDALNALNTATACLRQAAPQIAWSPIENLHITTKFIGDWPAARLDELKDALSNVPKTGPIPIRITGVGWFPNPHSPRVFWAAVTAPDALRTLAKNTDQAVGLEPETREYHPHLTLARIKTPGNLAPLRQAVAKLDSVDFGSFVAQSFFLYLSEPTTKSSKYTKLAEFTLT